MPELSQFLVLNEAICQACSRVLLLAERSRAVRPGGCEFGEFGIQTEGPNAVAMATGHLLVTAGRARGAPVVQGFQCSQRKLKMKVRHEINQEI